MFTAMIDNELWHCFLFPKETIIDHLRLGRAVPQPFSYDSLLMPYKARPIIGIIGILDKYWYQYQYMSSDILDIVMGIIDIG